ncbi:MAG: glycoside-pentoside-hexuronide (GPH):cation symporter [Spirochaetia bacterium]|nr:glycoside-pentoside-hexuronide (GPH):cation symporter [Spirochaetia bacterium]MCF7941570.1 glycoside-pentoside-hexuronide (GPH):cation symporter [Spirochaetia bacterium]
MEYDKDRKVTFRTLFSYGIGDIFGGGSFLIIGMLFMFYLTEVAGLSPALAGLVFAIGKIWDAISDPLMGYFSDITESKHGRRRIYFLIGIVPIAVSFILMWVPVSFGASAARFVYYSFTYVLFSTVFTMVMIPYAALNAEMTNDYRVRSKLSAARMICSGISALLAGTIPSMIISRYPAGTGSGYMVMAVIFGLLYAAPWIVVYSGTWEMPYTRRRRESSSLEVFRQFSTVIKNSSFRIHVGMYIAAYSASDILMALFVYFITYYLQRQNLYPVAMGSLMIVQIAMMPVYTMISNTHGKGTAYVAGLTLYAVSLITAFFVLTPESSVVTIALVCAFIGTGTSAGVLIPWAILPSVIDVDELITGKKRSGVYSGAMTLIRKMVQGLIAMPLIGFMLTSIQFVPGQEQSPEVLEGLHLFFLLGPLTLVLIGIFLGLKFRITPSRHSLIINEIERLKQGGSKDEVTSEVRTACELLTGVSYKELYPQEV